MLELGVVTAESPIEWARTIARTAVGTTARSPFVQMTRARTIEVKLSKKVLYELDGGDREKVKSSRSRSSPARSRCSSRWRREHRNPRPRDLGADRRRRPEDACRHRANAARGRRVHATRYADGFSHARSLAFDASSMVQGLIALVGFAAAFGNLEAA